MLSTSILYCNKLDDGLLETIDSASAVTAGSKSKSQLSNRSSKSVPTALNPSAISAFSEAATSDLSGQSRPTRFRVRYLGCNTCDPRTHRLDNGIAAYQKPLLDLYSTVLRRSVVLRSLYSSISAINQVADLSTHGIVIAERDRFSSGKSAQQQLPQPRPNSSVSSSSAQKASAETTVVTKVITPLSNILLWAAVKFQHRSNLKKKSKGSSVKRRQIGVAFVPLSCSEAVLDKNAFVSLNAKQRFLLGLPHPPLFACVLQKVNSGQRLECHLFVCLTSDDAIRMCNQMAELRHRNSSIGKLHIPPPGQMGSYSYKGTPLQSSAASMVSNRSSSYAISELSSFIAKHHFSANSDIEEEEDNARPFDDQMDSLNSNSNTTSAVKSIAKQLAPQFPNGRLATDQRLLERTRRTAGPAKHHFTPVGTDSMSWTELSSISSALISTKSEPNKSRVGSHVAAQRDYRFQAYKCPQNFVLPEISKPSDDRKPSCDPSIVAIKKNPIEVKVVEKAVVSHGDSSSSSHHNNKWSSVSDELQSNRLFAKASAIAALETRSREATPSYECDSNFGNRANARALGEVSVHEHENSRPNSTQRFFGDTLRGPKTAPKPEVTKAHLKRTTQSGSKAPVVNQLKLISKDYKVGGGGGGDRTISPRESKKERRGDKVLQQQQQSSANRRASEVHPFANSNLKSTISNSIFFDEEESSEQSTQQQQHHKQSASGEQNAAKNGSPEGHAARESAKQTKSEPKMMVEQSPRSYQRNKQRREKMTVKSDVPVVLYLPTESSLPSNVGVKCFNTSTPVDKWSTMISSNVSNNSLRENECELCSLEMNCEECCTLCQSIEQKRLSCPDCILDGDDIVLDEFILQNFSKHQSMDSNREGQAQTDGAGLPAENGNLYRYDIPMANMPRLDANINRSQSRKSTWLGRIRQLGSSIFGSRSRTSNRSRIWSRLRTGSQKLKGSKRFTSKSSGHSSKEPLNRIFLPAPNGSSGGCRVYSEHYLKPPPPPSTTAATAAKAENGREVDVRQSKSSSEVKQLSVAMNQIDLSSGKKGRERSQPKESRNGLTSPAKQAAASAAATNKAIQKRSHVKGHTEIVNPFFIRHPSKLAVQSGLEVSQCEFNPGQVLSISSDSGMEEYDCHSSNEYSPLGYQVVTSHLNSGKASDEQRSKGTKGPVENGQQANNNHRPPQFTHLPHCQCSRCGPSRAGVNSSVYASSRQVGHWSETNLQNELGYMP